MRIIDADGHVAEGASLVVEAMQRWPDYIEPRKDVPGLVIEGRNYPESSGPGAGCPTEHGISAAEGINCRSAEGVLGDADRDQIDTMVLYPSLGLCTPTLEDTEFAAGFARLYNEWIADYCASSGGRLRGIAVTPIEHGDVAIDIMREARDLGLVATHIPPALKSRNLDHPDLDPFYAAVVELGMPLGIHGAPGVHLPKIGVDRFTNYIQVHCISFPFDQMTAMTALVSGGVFDRHPDLRVAFLEAGVGWVPFEPTPGRGNPAATGSTAAGSATRRSIWRQETSGRHANPRSRSCPASSTYWATTSSCSPATTRTGTANGRRAQSICVPGPTSARRPARRSAA